MRAASRWRGSRYAAVDDAVVALARSSVEPFLQFSSRRDLREGVPAPGSRAATGGKTDNKAVHRRDRGAACRACQAARLRDLRALPARRRHGEDAGRGARSAGPCRTERKGALADRDAMQELVRAGGRRFRGSSPGTGATSLRSRRYPCRHDEPTVKLISSSTTSRCELYTAFKLFGLTLSPQGHRRLASRRDACPGSLEGPPPRPVFRRLLRADHEALAGAWMTTLRNRRSSPRPTSAAGHQRHELQQGRRGEPTLLSFDDARTLFHEFGHALHELLSDVTCPMVAGTSVLHQLGRLPSQLYEHWLELRHPAAFRDPRWRRPARSRPAQAPARCAQFQPRLRHRGVRLVGAVRSRRASTSSEGFRRRRIRGCGARENGHAGTNRDAAPADAFCPRVLRRRLRLGLLRLMSVEVLDADAFAAFRSRRHLRSGDGEELDHAVLRRRQERSGSALHGVSRAPARPPTRCFDERAQLARRAARHGPAPAPDIDAASSARRIPRRRSRARSSPRRQRDRGDGSDGGDDRGGLSAHERHRRRRLLADREPGATPGA